MWGEVKDKEDPHIYYIISYIVAVKTLASVNSIAQKCFYSSVLFENLRKKRITKWLAVWSTCKNNVIG